MGVLSAVRKWVVGGMVGAVAGSAMVSAASPAQALGGFHVYPNWGPWNMRAQPNLTSPIVGVLQRGQAVDIECQVIGVTVSLNGFTSNVWDRIGGKFVTDLAIQETQYGKRDPRLPDCNAPAPPPPPPSPPSFTVNPNWGPWTLRQSATTLSPAVGTLQKGQKVTIECQVVGQSVSVGGYTSTIWDRIGGKFVSDLAIMETQYAKRDPRLPDCGGGQQTPVVPGYKRDVASQWAFNNALNGKEDYRGADCTAFVSRALWAGGLPASETWKSDAKKSIPFIRADALVNYLQTAGLATKIPIAWADNSVGGAQLGDVIAYDWDDRFGRPGSDGKVDHLAMVTRTVGGVHVSQHSAPRQNRFWSWDPGHNNGTGYWIEYTRPGSKVYLIKVK